MKIKASDKFGSELLVSLAELVVENGGAIHPELQVNVTNGDISLTYCRKPARKSCLISVPLKCMPILSDFKYDLSGGRLTANPVEGRTVSSIHQMAMEMSVELYNLYDKVEAYSRLSPPIVLEEKYQLRRTLLKAVKAEALAEPNMLFGDNMKIAFFWGNRGYYDTESATDRMLTFLEFVNHHSVSEAFRPKLTPEGEGSVELSFYPVNDGSKGVYASYSLMDALESFVKYGFVDQSAFFLKSQPFSIELPIIGKVKIDNLDVNSNQFPPDNWNPSDRNASFYASQIQFEEGQPPKLAFCLIPPKRHIKACDEVFCHYLKCFEQWVGSSVGSINNNEALQIFKRALVLENKHFYRGLVHLAKEADLDVNAPVTIMLRSMLKHQVELIKQYEKKSL